MRRGASVVSSMIVAAPQNRSWSHGWGNRIVIVKILDQQWMANFGCNVAHLISYVGNSTAAPSTKMHHTHGHTTAEENINNFVMMPAGGVRPSATYFQLHER